MTYRSHQRTTWHDEDLTTEPWSDSHTTAAAISSSVSQKASDLTIGVFSHSSLRKYLSVGSVLGKPLLGFQGLSHITG